MIGGNAKIEAANDPNTTNTISALISRGDFYVKENATLTIDSNGGGISSDGKIFIAGNTDVLPEENEQGAPYVNITSYNTPINGNNGVDISGSSEVTAKATYNSALAISSFYGDINLGGRLNLTGGGSQPTVACGVYNVYPGDIIDSSDCDITVTGDLTISNGAIGIAITGSGNINIENANVTLEDVQSGLFTRNSGIYSDAEINGGYITINNSSLSIADSSMGIYTNSIKGETEVAIKNSEVLVNSANWGIYTTGDLLVENSTIECCPTNASNRSIGVSGNITYNYASGLHQIVAGTTKDSATIISGTEEDSHLTDPYVRIESRDRIPASDISLNSTNLHLYTNIDPKSYALVADIEPKDTTDTIIWNSEDSSVATVDNNGVVKAVGDGTTTIMATIGDIKATCEVSVSTYHYTGSYNYPVNIDDVENGSLSVAKEDQWATKGEEITVTVVPDEGYMLNELTIISNGKEIEYIDNGDSTITFTMPEGAVNIEPSFVVDPNYEKPTDPEDPIEPSMPFIDVNADDWFYDAVQYVFDKGIMTGTGATTFEPGTSTTRGMIVSILHRLEGSPVVTNENFSDVIIDDWYGQAVAWASSEGIVGGYGDGTFQPEKDITREEMASILYRYSLYKGYDVSDRADLSGYTDAPSAWAMEVMQWANAEGVINGMTDTTLDAQGNATRAQVAAMFQRYLENVSQ